MSSGTTSTIESAQCVFFGSGPVAARSLELLSEHTAIEAVVTKPKPAHHRGEAPVIEFAETHDLPLYTASTKSELDGLIQQTHFASRYAVLIDFGIIVSQSVIDTFALGIINSHFSLLPRLRGADPITWAIADGEPETGVSLMLIDDGMDTGKLLAQRSLSLDSSETAPTLTDTLIDLSDRLIREYVPQYLAGELSPYDQPHPDRATYSRKLTKADGVIDLSQPADVIERRIRAFVEWPQSRTRLGDIDVIVTQAHVSDEATELSLPCGDGRYLAIDALKPSGKKEMPARAFLAGYRHKLHNS
ncbi:hypothetical protein CR983_03710 [Candidatus Saccharibacteria bacterium]|nr:MAG: hypothetical protein CR983_03710 [Candidatus Saccharibacteria bacterium]